MEIISTNGDLFGAHICHQKHWGKKSLQIKSSSMYLINKILLNKEKILLNDLKIVYFIISVFDDKVRSIKDFALW